MFLLCLLFIFIFHVVCLRAIPTSQKRPESEELGHIATVWGPYRPNLYYGLRAKSPDSPLLGLMWARRENGRPVENSLRHTCEQSDHMEEYGWTTYDPKLGGSQTIQDVVNGLALTTDFVRRQGNSWASRIRGIPRVEAGNTLQSTVVFYISVPGLHSTPRAQLHCFSVQGGAECEGSTSGVGSFRISINYTGSVSPDVKSSAHLWGVAVPDDTLWQAKAIFLERLQQTISENDSEDSNIYFLDLSFQDAFELDISYSTNSAEPPLEPLDFWDKVKSVSASFSEHFNEVYEAQYPFDDGRFENCSKALLSNLLGGLGYFYGTSRVDSSQSPAFDEAEPGFWRDAEKIRLQHEAHVLPSHPTKLFSFVPSRPFFPRGFLWDEGFHLLLVMKWDLDLAVEVLKSWFALMDEDGWIAREQILGPEARSKVPPEFQVQYPHYANPPTFFLVVATLCEILTTHGHTYKGHPSRYIDHEEAGVELITHIYPLMERHYKWFKRTQAGNMAYARLPSAVVGYRWRGRTLHHTLTSGLDDYPRATPPHPGELHVDAISWVGAMADSLGKVAAFLGRDEERISFTKETAYIIQSIGALHWSSEESVFCDTTVDGHDKHELVCRVGYVSLFPFLLGLTGSDDHRVGALLDILRNPDYLWSSYGIRSLSKADRYYGTDENYWRGPIWVNINYLILKRLLILASTLGPYQDKARSIYAELRKNIVTTVVNSWHTTNFAWEQYSPDTGAGQRTQHFTGWTALVVEIMAMPDIVTDDYLPQAPSNGSFGRSTKVWLFLTMLAILLLVRKRNVKMLR